MQIYNHVKSITLTVRFTEAENIHHSSQIADELVVKKKGQHFCKFLIGWLDEQLQVFQTKSMDM